MIRVGSEVLCPSILECILKSLLGVVQVSKDSKQATTVLSPPNQNQAQIWALP